jgi:hypothetical protein
MMALERAREQGVGHSIAHPVRAVPRWNATAAPAAPQEITQ